MYDLIIIGGGPAGMTAGIYSSRQQLNTLLITKEFGGQMARKAVSIENYPGLKSIPGSELVEKLKSHLEKFDPDIKKTSVVRVEKKEGNFEVETTNDKFQSRTVIIASGADPRPLEVPGEKKFIGKGVSYCSICDGALFADKKVAIIGGGDSGFESALFLKDYASKIYILEYSSEVNASVFNKRKTDEIDKINVITSAQLKKIKGDDFVSSIIYKDRENEEKKELEVEGVFVEIGNQPATSFVNNLVEFNEKDEIKIDPKTNATKVPGLFAAGDVTEVKYNQIVIAAGEGCKAALSAYQYIQEQK